MCVLSSEISKKVEGIHTEFLQLIMGKQAMRLGYSKWETPGAEGIRESVITQSARTYIEIRQATVDQWVFLRPLFEFYANGEMVRRRRAKEGGVVAPKGNRETTSGHPGRLA